jgi:ubiquitin C-terminal hydrolase
MNEIIYIPVGIANLGNTCFLNVCLQILLQCPQIAQSLEKTSLNETKVEMLILKQWYEIYKVTRQNKKKTLLFPRDLLNAVRQVAKQKKMEHFAGIEQNDFGEFLLFFVESLHQCICKPRNIMIDGNPKSKVDILAIKCYEMLQKQYGQEYSEFNDIFYGISVSRLHSLSNDSVVHSIVPESFFMIDLPILEKNSTIYECLDKYSASETMTGENAWYNENTNQKEDIRKTLSFFRLPKLLFICLKRFSFDGVCKNNALVQFPNVLEMKKYYCGYHSVQQTFQLKSVCYHFGSLDNGHYTTSVCEYNTKKWYYCNDENIQEVDKDLVIKTTKNVYCLVYEQIE